MAEINFGNKSVDDFGLSIKSTFNSRKSESVSTVNQKPTDTNVEEIFKGSDWKFDIVDPPKPPADVEQYNEGTQTTPPLGRGVVNNSLIYKANLTTDHACHLYAGFNMTSLTANLGLNDLFKLPPSRIQASIQLRINFSGIMQKLREALNAILEALGADITGEISYWYSEAKKLVRWVKKTTKWILQLVSDIQALAKFINELIGVIYYILSLPTKLLAMVENCIFGFLGSIAALPAQLAAIPGAVVGGTIDQSLKSLTNMASSAQNTVTQRTSESVTEKNGISLNSSASDITNAVGSTSTSTLTSTQGNKP